MLIAHLSSSYRGSISRVMESSTGNHDFIYNATKAEPEDHNREEDDTNRQSHLFPGGRELDGHLAMLLASLPEMLPAAANPEERMKARLQEGRSKTLPDNWTISKANDSLENVFKDAGSKMSGLRRWGRGRIISYSEADSGTKRPRWVLNLISPVQPFVPKYPPPERSPTPPGLPTFGTPEAINYTSQFDVRSSLPNHNGPIRQSTSRASSRRVTESYPHTLRRILGLGLPSSSSTAPMPTSQTDRRHGCIVARAEDGTAVLGRFPYRASGHGTNLNRNIEYHPFHQDQLRIASLDDRHRSRGRQSSSRTRSPDPDQHASRFSRRRFSITLPSVPEPAARASPAMLTYDGEAGAGAGGNGAYANTTPSPLPTDTGPYDLTRCFWDGYAALIQYIPCCVVPADDTISGSVDDISGPGSGPGSGTCSRTSDETFVSALDYRHGESSRTRVSLFSGWNQVDFNSLRRSMLGGRL